ncbi:hypothetical protein [Pseudomonas peli]|uniref:hypothetical protein n=1 Tax=Pseudomonas peli TaxID=592361 RepID=UPI00285D7D80|nr:hypothetical protein [Pseudomonas peli]MDR7024692.1 hypothetical protein [Pseudomonas peli]
MISGRLLKQYDMPVALGITHLTAVAFLLNSSEATPTWVASYAYFFAVFCILLCRIFQPPKGFLSGIAVATLAATVIRSINYSNANVHGPGVDFPLGLMGAGAGAIAALIYSKSNNGSFIASGFAIGCAGTLGGYLLSMLFACSTILYCGPAFSWGF